MNPVLKCDPSKDLINSVLFLMNYHALIILTFGYLNNKKEHLYIFQNLSMHTSTIKVKNFKICPFPTVSKEKLVFTLIVDDPMEDVGFGAGEGLDFFEDFTLGEMQDVTGVDNLIEEAAPLDDTTINKLSDESTAEEVAQEERDKEVSDAVAELTSGDLSSVVDFDRETKDATVPEQPTGEYLYYVMSEHIVSYLFVTPPPPLDIISKRRVTR